MCMRLLVKRFRYWLWVLHAVVLVACGQTTLTPGSCDHTDNENGNAKAKGNAGCLIQGDNGWLLIQQHSGKWSIPGGTANWSETASCTAARETQEETGLSVNVGALLGQWKNGFYIYQCTLMSSNEQQIYSPPNTLTGKGEVTKVAWRDPNTLTSQDWRYPKQWSWLLALSQTHTQHDKD